MGVSEASVYWPQNIYETICDSPRSATDLVGPGRQLVYLFIYLCIY